MLMFAGFSRTHGERDWNTFILNLNPHHVIKHELWAGLVLGSWPNQAVIISFCCKRKHSVTGSGGAGWKIKFGKGIQLNVEDSEYLIH